ncbi:hypothetical protein [Paraburkholderia sp. BCC1876]|uniref:hypothetical protein n=1 Tax=Paraburkholderia sp. BCC1876 TaxID=2676303 RepID=UPI001FC87D3E|nr:hypothetical protein [Paraburkholderia sp. BCC1876]
MTHMTACEIECILRKNACGPEMHLTERNRRVDRQVEYPGYRVQRAGLGTGLPALHGIELLDIAEPPVDPTTRRQRDRRCDARTQGKFHGGQCVRNVVLKDESRRAQRGRFASDCGGGRSWQGRSLQVDALRRTKRGVDIEFGEVVPAAGKAALQMTGSATRHFIERQRQGMFAGKNARAWPNDTSLTLGPVWSEFADQRFIHVTLRR